MTDFQLVLNKLLKPQHTEMWGETYDFTPALLSKSYGDGKQLLMLFPIMERPRYWVVRVDSKCLDDDLREILDDVYEQIDDQFGRPNEEDLGVGDERPYFPMCDGDGCVWHFVPINARRSTAAEVVPT
jgi:hypothetical protein